LVAVKAGADQGLWLRQAVVAKARNEQHIRAGAELKRNEFTFKEIMRVAASCSAGLGEGAPGGGCTIFVIDNIFYLHELFAGLAEAGWRRRRG
jgi:hypothetical protein